MSFGRKENDPLSGSNAASSAFRANIPSGGTVSSSSGAIDAFIGRGCKVVGSLIFTGPVELDGEIDGEIVAKDRLTIGESAIIKAKISGSEILVKGTVTGDIVASKALTLKKPAKIVGNISSAVLSIEEGVVFEGKCSMVTSSGGAASRGDPLKSAADKAAVSA